jgi:hypothetical protein
MWNPSQKIIVIQLLAVPENVALNLTGVDPGHEVFHVAGNQESRIIDNLCSDADVTLFDECGGLYKNQLIFTFLLLLGSRFQILKIRFNMYGTGAKQRVTHSLNSLNHTRAHHKHSQTSPAKRRDSDFALDPGKTGALFAGLFEDSHAPQFLQEFGLQLLAQGVCFWVQLGEPVGELAEGAAEGVVFFVVHRILEEVSLAHLVFAVPAIGFVVMEVDLLEKPVVYIVSELYFVVW